MKTNITYDEKFTRDGESTVAGVFFVVVPILFTIACVLNQVQFYGSEVYIPIMAIGAILSRVVAMAWIKSIAHELNRSSVRWMILAFFLPGIALTIIGNKKKFKVVDDYHKYLYKKPATDAPVVFNNGWQAA